MSMQAEASTPPDFDAYLTPSSTLYERSLKNTDSGEPLWGLNIQRGGVSIMAAPTSAGKSVLLGALAHHLSLGKEFLGLTPPRPLRVLTVDFEGYDAVYKELLAAYAPHENWDYLEADRLRALAALVKPVSGEDWQRAGRRNLVALRGVIEHGTYDVAFIDPLPDFYPVPNENDNSQAAEQIIDLRMVARRLNVGIFTTYNTGHRGERNSRNARLTLADSRFYGRGASARLDKADVGMNYAEIEDDERRLVVTKSRRNGHRGFAINVQFTGNLGFKVLDEVAVPPPPPSPTALDDILKYLAGLPEGKAPRSDIEAAVPAARSTVQNAFDKGKAMGCLTVPERGVWAITEKGRFQVDGGPV